MRLQQLSATKVVPINKPSPQEPPGLRGVKITERLCEVRRRLTVFTSLLFSRELGHG